MKTVIDTAVLVIDVPLPDLVIELGKGINDGHRGQVSAAEPADFPLDAALLVGALDPGVAVESVEPVVGPEQQPPLVLGSLPAGTVDDFHDRVGEIVVSDVSGRDAPDVLESVDVAFEERFLRLGRIDPMDRLAGVGQTEGEHMALDLHPSQHHPDLPEVDFRLRPRRMFLRDKHLRQPAGLRINLRATSADVVTDRRVGQLPCPVLISEAGEDTSCGMTLFARSFEVLPEHHVDRGLEHIQPGRCPHPGLSLWWFRLPQCLPDSWPADTMTSGQLPDRKTLHARITPDPRKNFHPRLHSNLHLEQPKKRCHNGEGGSRLDCP